MPLGYRATATWLGRDAVYLVGGSDGTRQARPELGDGQIWVYSLRHDQWSLVNTTTANGFPEPRWKHAAVAISATQILVTGGRFGQMVHDDAWILDTAKMTWTPLRVAVNATSAPLPTVYRHGMTYDSVHRKAYLYGGLDGSLNRYASDRLWTLQLPSEEAFLNTGSPATVVVEEISLVPDPITSSLPPRLASHVLEYIESARALLAWGGTCGDSSELYLLDTTLPDKVWNWCTVTPPGRPDRRDAPLWSLSYPYLYVAQGDSICYNRQVLGLADVHRMDLSNLADLKNTSTAGWDMLYEPYNARGTGLEPYCNGTNAGECQPRPLLLDVDGGASHMATTTCSADFLKRFAMVDFAVESVMPTMFASLEPSSAPILPAVVRSPFTDDTVSKEDLDAIDEIASGASFSMPAPHYSLLWTTAMVLWFWKGWLVTGRQ